MADNTQYYTKTFENLSAEKKDRILKVITSEFANNGFEKTSVSQIAHKSGISVGSLYKYFDSKEDMFSFVVQEGLSELRTMLSELEKADEDIAVKAEIIIREIIKFSKKKPELIKLYCALTADGSSELLSGFAQKIEQISAQIYTNVIEKAQETGDVRKDANPEFFAFLLDSLFMMLQFSASCDYYKKRFAVYMNEPFENCEELIVKEMLSFLKAAFNFK